MGLVSLSIEGVVPVSFAATGVLAGFLGVRATFFLGGAVILVATAVAFTRPRLRSFQLPQPEVSPPATLSDHIQTQTSSGEQRRPETLTLTVG